MTPRLRPGSGITGSRALARTGTSRQAAGTPARRRPHAGGRGGRPRVARATRGVGDARRALARRPRVLGELQGGVRRADLQDPGLVEDRDRDRRGSRVELPEVSDRGLVLGRLAGVRGRLPRIPLPGLSRGVIEGLVRELALARLVAGLGQRELLALDHVQRLPAAGALQREARVDGERLTLGGASAARLSAAGGYTDDECRNAHRRHQPTN